MKKILLVDDDKILLKIILNSLKDYTDRFDFIKAFNGKEAVDILNKEPVALLITDIKMPEMDGLSLLAHVNENHPSIPCFVMTAFDTSKLRKILPKDIIRFYKKPFHVDKLGPAIEETLGREEPTGVLYGISVISFLMMIEMEKKTCIFEVHLPDEKKGLFYFEKGILYEAACGDLRGEEAALELITNQRARFRFRPLPKGKITKRENMNLRELTHKASSTDEKNKKSIETSPVEKLNLPGTFKSEKDLGGQMIVINMSIPGILFKLDMEHNLSDGEKLQLEFTLDDKPRTPIRKDVYVHSQKGLYVSAEFCFKEHYDKLGPYIRYNKLDNHIIFNLAG